jgi:hypothetical protein
LIRRNDSPTNFITNRYPQLLRVACMAAADFMKDTEEYNKQFQRLVQMIGWRCHP